MNISRRSFVKGTAGALAATAALGGVAAVNTGMFEKAEASTTGGEWKPSSCAYCHYPACATQVRVENGIAMEIKGDPNGTNKGRLCARGLSAIGQLYSPYRVQAPMKRTNPEKLMDNDPGWVEIEWEEAFSTVAEKLIAAREYHPDSIAYIDGFGLEESFKASAYFICLGTQNLLENPGSYCPEHFNGLHHHGQMLDRLDLEYVDYVVEAGRTMGSEFCCTSASHSSHYAGAIERGMEIVSVNPVCNKQGQDGKWVPIMPGTDAAFGLALLNVMLHEIGEIDEHWLKIRSNSPYLVDDNLVDYKGREVHKGTYVRNADSKPLVYDEAKGEVVPFDDSMGEDYALFGSYEVDGVSYRTGLQVLKDFVADKTPEWQEEFTTIDPATVREIANNLVKYARIGSTIEINGYELPYRPACIYPGRGMAGHMLGVSAAKAYGAVNVLLGNLDVPGGMQGTYNASWMGVLADEDGVIEPTGLMVKQVTGGEGITYPPHMIDMQSWYPACHTASPVSWRTICDMAGHGFDYEIQVYTSVGADPVGGILPEGDFTLEALQKIPFIYTHVNNFDTQAQFSDIIFAEHALLEKDAIYRVSRNEKEGNVETLGLMGTLIRRPVIESIYNTMNVEDIQIEISDRLGMIEVYNAVMSFDEMFTQISPDYAVGLDGYELFPMDQKYSWREFIDHKICADFGEDALEYFETCAFMPYLLPEEQAYNYYWGPDNTVRLPLYYERQSRIGSLMESQLEEYGVEIPNIDNEHALSHYCALPLWYQEDAGWDLTDEYPLKAFSWKIHYGPNNTGGTYNNAVMNDVIDTHNPNIKKVWIAPSVAEAYGLVEDDMINIESKNAGSTTGPVHITNLIHPNCIGIPGAFGRRHQGMIPLENPGTYFNPLISSKESTINPVSMALETSPQVKITKL